MTAYLALKEGGILAINIANVKSFTDLVETTERVSEECGFKKVDELKLALSTLPSVKRAWKYEPILVFTKK